jgi:hypothetical protein
MPQPPPREATGRGEGAGGGGGCRQPRVHEAGKPQWILWNRSVCTSGMFLSIGPWSNVAI